MDRVQEDVLMEFIKEGAVVRLIIATTAFGMGIDCPDIKQIYHQGPPHTVEEYVQEAGRAGRNQELSYATLIYNKPRGDISDMHFYGKNTSICRHYDQLLFKTSYFTMNLVHYLHFVYVVIIYNNIYVLLCVNVFHVLLFNWKVIKGNYYY